MNLKSANYLLLLFFLLLFIFSTKCFAFSLDKNEEPSSEIEEQVNTLQGMLNKTNRELRSLWWMYKSYGDLTGQIVEIAPGNTTDPVVAIDARFNSADVVEERIENSEDLPLKNPEKTFKQSLKFRNGQMEVILDDLRSFDAYTLTISLSEKKL